MNQKTKSLFLSAWYPNPNDAMEGLFVRKHAEAVGLYCDVKVLFAYPDKNAKKITIEHIRLKHAEEIIVSYPIKGKNIIAKISKTINFFRAYYKGYRHIRKNGFEPDIIQVNVLTRMALIAYVIKKLTGIPYVVIEHWSRYLPQNRESYNGCLRHWLTKFATRQASAIMPVSEYLKNAMIEKGLKNNNYITINNVVDDFFFVSKEKEKREKKRILHVSCFTERTKNVCGILNAVKKVSLNRTDFELILIGSGPDFNIAKECAKKLNLEESLVSFLGELAPENVALWMQKSDFFVLFSYYETSGVVIAESLCSGIPVIGTNVGGIPELIDENNGKLVPVADEEALAQQINWMLDHHQEYDAEKIKQMAIQRFSYEYVGKNISEIYEKVLCKK